MGAEDGTLDIYEKTGPYVYVGGLWGAALAAQRR